MTPGTRSIVLVLLALGLVAPAALARPPKGPYESFRIKTDNVPQAEIAGWVLPAQGHARGTMFLLHGWNNNKELVVGWEWVRDRENWNVVMFDFREHGESSRSAHLSSLGYYEIWDVKAVVDYAEKKSLARPYVIYGRSLGASTGLRWASMDRRIDGVFAVSPFKNAYLASQQLPAAKLHIGSLPSPFALHNGFKRMLEEVDIPKAVAARDDLRIWILVGENDCFPVEDQRAILAASPSPPGIKRLVVAAGCNHHNVWTWKGSANGPGHDDYLRQFLSVSRRDRAAWAGKWVAVVGCAFAVGVIALLALVRRTWPRRPPSPGELLQDPIPT
ncbi:MAG TPA: alpha/beta fold hydrolase [Tepidisphaeraceae bacterium]|jgi:pimeloyl-ACP methyl ester carboxylesterase